MPLLEFSRAAFWVQIHNVLERSFTQAIGKAIGNTIGKVIVVANPKDDGVGNEFLRVRVSIDISKPLSRCRKLWAEGKQVGWVLSAFPIFVTGVAGLHMAKESVSCGSGVKEV